VRLAPARLARGIPDPGNFQLAPHHAHLLQAPENLLRHALRQIDKAVILADVHMPDKAPLEPGLVGGRAYDIARLHAVHMPNLYAEPLEFKPLATTPFPLRGMLASLAHPLLFARFLAPTTWLTRVLTRATLLTPGVHPALADLPLLATFLAPAAWLTRALMRALTDLLPLATFLAPATELTRAPMRATLLTPAAGLTRAPMSATLLTTAAGLTRALMRATFLAPAAGLTRALTRATLTEPTVLPTPTAPRIASIASIASGPRLNAIARLTRPPRFAPLSTSSARPFGARVTTRRSRLFFLTPPTLGPLRQQQRRSSM